MSRRKPIDAKILEASKEFNAHIFVETVKGMFSDFPNYRCNQKRIVDFLLFISCDSLWFFAGAIRLKISDYAHPQAKLITQEV